MGFTTAALSLGSWGWVSRRTNTHQWQDRPSAVNFIEDHCKYLPRCPAGPEALAWRITHLNSWTNKELISIQAQLYSKAVFKSYLFSAQGVSPNYKYKHVPCPKGLRSYFVSPALAEEWEQEEEEKRDQEW